MAKEQVSSILRALQILECFMDSGRSGRSRLWWSSWACPRPRYFGRYPRWRSGDIWEQDPVRKSYRPGPRLLLLSSAILGQSDLRRTARPELERLSDTLQETINLSMLLERDIFYLDKVETHRSIVCNTQVGSGHRPMPPAPARRFWPARVMIILMSTAAGWNRQLTRSQPIPL